MSLQTFFGSIVLTTLAAGGFQVLGLVTEPPMGIDIVSLKYEQTEDPPYIIQDRIVTATSALTARWAATVSILDGSKLVPICHGSGYWDYETGRKKAEILFDDWVGQAGCYDLIPEGARFVLSAEYKWGDSGLTRKNSHPMLKR